MVYFGRLFPCIFIRTSGFKNLGIIDLKGMFILQRCKRPRALSSSRSHRYLAVHSGLETRLMTSDHSPLDTSPGGGCPGPRKFHQSNNNNQNCHTSSRGSLVTPMIILSWFVHLFIHSLTYPFPHSPTHPSLS